MQTLRELKGIIRRTKETESEIPDDTETLLADGMDRLNKVQDFLDELNNSIIISREHSSTLLRHVVRIEDLLKRYETLNYEGGSGE